MSKTIRSMKAFNAALETLRAGEVEAYNESLEPEKLITTLRKYRDKYGSGRFSELTAYINDAAEQGLENRMRNRNKQISEFAAQEREARYLRQANGFPPRLL